MTASDDSSVASRRRPRDRRRRILVAARELFAESGYPNVTMVQIADRVGITAGALYRHFTNKSVLLEQVVAESFQWIDELVPSGEFGQTIEAMLELALDRPYLADLWAHEIRYLPEPQVRELWRRMSGWRASLLAALRDERADLDDGQAELLAWTLQSLMSCLARRAMHGPMSLRVPVVRAAMHAVTSVRLAPTGGSVADGHPKLTAASVRERLLAAALKQFAQQGYAETTMASLGAAANVTGQNLYSYFGSKADLLRAVLERATHALWLGLDDALARSTTASQVLKKLIENYIARAGSWAATLEDPTGQSAFEENALATQREYVAEWVALLLQVHPDIPASQARTRVQLVLFLISDLHAVPRLRRDTAFGENLTRIASTILVDYPDFWPDR